MEPIIDRTKLQKWQDEIKSHKDCINQRWSRKIIKYLIPSGIINDQWFTRWEDLDDESKHIADYVLNIYKYGYTEFYKSKKTEYVLESLLIEFWTNYNGELPNIGFYDSSTFERFWKYSSMSFSLISGLFHRMVQTTIASSFENYNKYLDDYYNRKMNIPRYKDFSPGQKGEENMQRRFKLLCRIKRHNSEFYYKELKKLTLSPGTWTHLFKMDYLHNTRDFSFRHSVVNYYKDVPLLYNHLRKKFKIAEFTLTKL